MTKGKPLSKRLSILSLARNLTSKQEHQLVAMADRARKMEQAADRVHDADMGPRLSTWRHTPCEHSLVVLDNSGNVLDSEDSCSPCLRDRLLQFVDEGVTS